MKINSTLSYSPVFRKKKKFHSNLEVIQFYASFLNSIKRYSLDGANIFLHWLLCHQQLYVSLFGLTSIFKFDNKSIYLYNFWNRNLNFVGQLFATDGKLKS